MPFTLKDAEFKRLDLSIDKGGVNDFLGLLWDDFTRSIGPMGSYQNYFGTEDPEIYEYCVSWAHKDLPFVAEFSFYNHTSKGITHVVYCAQDFSTRKTSPEYESKIKASILRVANDFSARIPAEPKFIMVPFRTGIKLSGNYILPLSEIYIIKPQLTQEGVDGHIIFQVNDVENYELQFEGATIAQNILAALSLATQWRFTITDGAPWSKISTNLIHSLRAQKDSMGQWKDDSGFHTVMTADGPIHQSSPEKQVVDSDDCIVDGKLVLPQRTDALVSLIIKNIRYIQACRRFQEGLNLRTLMNSGFNEIYTISYELIAYVSAIETLLDVKKVQIDISCPRCNTVIAKEEWKISEKFKKFVDDHSGKNLNMSQIFKTVYEDRSKFVHTGVNLHHYLAHRPNRPMILMGKKVLSNLPNYYFNIHELTGSVMRTYFYGQMTTNPRT